MNIGNKSGRNIVLILGVFFSNLENLSLVPQVHELSGQKMMPGAYSCEEHERHPLPKNLGNRFISSEKGEIYQNLLCLQVQGYSKEICL